MKYNLLCFTLVDFNRSIAFWYKIDCPLKNTQRIARNVYVREMGHGDEVLQYKKLHSITYVITDSYTVTSEMHIGPLGLRFPSGNVRGVKIPPNINLPKGLRSPWTVLRTIYTDYSNIKNVSLWPERDYGSTYNFLY